MSYAKSTHFNHGNRKSTQTQSNKSAKIHNSQTQKNQYNKNNTEFADTN